MHCEQVLKSRQGEFESPLVLCGRVSGFAATANREIPQGHLSRNYNNRIVATTAMYPPLTDMTYIKDSLLGQRFAQ